MVSSLCLKILCLFNLFDIISLYRFSTLNPFYLYWANAIFPNCQVYRLGAGSTGRGIVLRKGPSQAAYLPGRPVSLRRRKEGRKHAFCKNKTFHNTKIRKKAQTAPNSLSWASSPNDLNWDGGSPWASGSRIEK